MRHLFSTPLGQEIAPKASEKKIWPAIIGAIGALGAAGLSLYGQSQANKSNASMDAATRNWQSAENEKSRQWSYDMWLANNQYNTPSAQRQRLQEAGFNPWISGSGGMSNVSQQASTPPQSSTPQHSQMQPLPYCNFATAMANSVSTYLQSKQIDANVANQQAQTDKTNAETYAYLYKNLGEDAAYSFAKAHDMQVDENSYLTKSIQYDLQESEFKAKQQQLTFEINSRLSERERESALMKSEQEISNLVGQLNLWSSQADLNRSNIKVNDQKVKESISNVVRNIADAYKLKKEGDKYVADTKTINGIRDLIIEGMRFKNQILSEPANDAGARNQGKTGFRNWLISPEGQEELKIKGIKDNSGTLDVIQYAAGLYNDIIPNIFVPAY